MNKSLGKTTYCIERVFDKKRFLLGKENSTIKIENIRKRKLYYIRRLLMKGHFLGRRNLYYERTFHYEKLHKEKRAMKK